MKRHGLILLSLLTILAGAAAQAEVAREVKITSFNWISIEQRTAEICGFVTGNYDPETRVIIAADPGSNAGHYSAWPSKDNKWCAIVRTFKGRAEATTLPESTGAVASADVAKRR